MGRRLAPRASHDFPATTGNGDLADTKGLESRHGFVAFLVLVVVLTCSFFLLTVCQPPAKDLFAKQINIDSKYSQSGHGGRRISPRLVSRREPPKQHQRDLPSPHPTPNCFFRRYISSTHTERTQNSRTRCSLSCGGRDSQHHSRQVSTKTHAHQRNHQPFCGAVAGTLTDLVATIPTR